MWLRPVVPKSLWRAWQAHACSQQVQVHQTVLQAWPGHVASKHTSAGGLGMSCFSPMAALSRSTCLTVQVITVCSLSSMQTSLFTLMMPGIQHLLTGRKLGSSSVKSLLRQGKALASESGMLYLLLFWKTCAAAYGGGAGQQDTFKIFSLLQSKH